MILCIHIKISSKLFFSLQVIFYELIEVLFLKNPASDTGTMEKQLYYEYASPKYVIAVLTYIVTILKLNMQS